MKSRLFLALAVLCLFSSLSFAQQPAAPETPTFSSRSELVLVPVVVTDKSGAHVAGLKKEAFTIEDSKAPRRIAVFEEVHDAVPAGKAAAEEAGVIANYAPADPNSRRLVIVVLDLVNTPFINQARAKQALLKFVATSLPADEPIALFALTGRGLKQIHSFTTDTRALIAALHKVSGQISTADRTAEAPAASVSTTMPGEDEDTDMLAEVLSDADALYAAHVQRDSIRVTLAGLEQIAGAFAGIPGRKSVVWATGGFPFTIDDPYAFGRMGTDMVESYENTWRALNNASIAVYPVDVTGLSGQNLDGGFSRMIPQGSRPQRRGAVSAPRAIPYDRHAEQLDAMRAFAEATGGRAFINRNDIETGFINAARDSRSYYLVGFYLEGERKPGWHKLKVHVAAPGAQVRARDGFLVGTPAVETDAARQQAMSAALSSPVDYTGVHFAVRVTSLTRLRYEAADPAATPVKTPPEKKNVGFELLIPTGSVMIDAAQNNAVDFEIAIVGISKDGRVTADFVRKVNTNLTGETLAAAQSRGIATKDHVSVPPETQELRFVIRDNQTGRIGTLRVPTDVGK